MSATANLSSPGTLSQGINTILKATLIAGTLDISLACLNFYFKTQKTPVLVLQYVASAVFGKSAYTGGTTMPLSGLLFHYIVAFIWVTIFFLLYPKLTLFIKNSIGAGLLYAVLIWFVMNFLVLPLTQVTKPPFNLASALVGALILMIAIGLPLGLIMKKYYQRLIR
jgi:uncharacterized membrane protein YagU involved in acid resistance